MGFAIIIKGSSSDSNAMLKSTSKFNAY